MAIGTSDGNVYENDFEHAAAQHDPTLDKNRIDVYKGNPPDTKDNNVVEPSPTRDENVQTPNQLKNNLDIGKDPHNIYDEQGNIVDYDLSGRGPQAPGEPRGALESPGGTNTPGKQYETNLPPEEETKFQDWKQKYAPNDSGADYDLRGAYKAGLEPDAVTGHWPDTFKKPNHPTFSDQSMYAKDRPDLAGHWAEDGKTYIPPRDSSQDIKVNPWITITPEDIDRSINIGLGAGPGTIMGVRSATINKAALYKAQEMEFNGAHPDDIHAETGTFRGADTHWRQEISDAKAQLKDSAFDKNIIPNDPRTGGETNTTVSLKEQSKDFFGKTNSVSLKVVLDHPDLYAAYPQLAHTKVETLPELIRKARPTMQGAVRADGTIMLNKDLDPRYVKSVLLHEIQHKIQNEEGFAKGCNQENFLPPDITEHVENFNKAKYALQSEITKNTGVQPFDIGVMKASIKSEMQGTLTKMLEPYIEKAKEKGIYDQLKKIVSTETELEKTREMALENYRRLMGEVEARNVQTRMDFDKFMQAYKPPRSTEDRPRFVQTQK